MTKTIERNEYLYRIMDQLKAENAKLSSALKAMMVGTYSELCADRDAWQCRECSMSRNNDEDCAVTRAMDLLDVDMYGEHLEELRIEVPDD